MDLSKLSQQIKDEARGLGFDACGIAKAERLEREEQRLAQWLNEGRHGTMSWMAENFDKRVDPTQLVPGARSVISVLCSYHHPVSQMPSADEPRISQYALGKDYHRVLKEKLFRLYDVTERLVGHLAGRVFVDSAPVLDKAWAVRAGLGWLGKHTNVIHPRLGSWFFIGEMIVDAQLAYDQPLTDHCGHCRRCLEVCPTQAIYEPYKLDASRCIAYLTIELREPIPAPYHRSLGSWIFGCDLCQEVCPWNRKAEAGSTAELWPRAQLQNRGLPFWEELDLSTYRELFKDSAVKRTKYEGLKRNIQIVAQNLCKQPRRGG